MPVTHVPLAGGEREIRQPPHPDPTIVRPMRNATWLFTIAMTVAPLAACGDDDDNTGDDDVVIDASTGGIDAPSTPDATPPTPDAGVATFCTPTNTTNLTREVVASGFNNPVLVTAPKNDPRLFVVEQEGFIRIVQDGKTLATPFLDIRDRIRDSGNEQGLLGLAFPDDYGTTRRFFVHYTASNPSGDGVLAEFFASEADANVADASSETRLVTIDEPFSNHNGGSIEFGPDGMLYWGLGDGGDCNDPNGNGQNTSTPLGAILRLDVSTPGTAVGAAGNPFASGGDDRVYAYGLRNPWRMSFDRDTGDLYIGDVGQDAQEEISVLPAGTSGGQNYGWRIMEGDDCRPSNACGPGEGACTPPADYVAPVFSYSHPGGGVCSAVGGYVYRGACLPDMVGTYFFADYCTGQVTSFVLDGNTATNVTQQTNLNLEAGDRLPSFGQDGFGELYMTSFNGTVYRIVAAE